MLRDMKQLKSLFTNQMGTVFYCPFSRALCLLIKNPRCFWLCLRHKQFTVVCKMSQLMMVAIFKSIITLVQTLKNLVCCPYLFSLFSLPLFSSHASFPYLTLVNTCSSFTASAWLWLHCNVTVELFWCTCFLLCATF